MNKTLIAVITSFSFSITSCAIANDEPAQLVNIEYAKTQEVKPTMWLPGNVISRRSSSLSSEQAGQLLWVVDVGTRVSKGQLLAKIDNRHLKLRLQQQKSELKKHQANVNYLEKQNMRLSTLNKMNNTALSEFERITKDLAIAVNEVEALELAMEQTLLALEKSEIKAPFAGSISERLVSEGEFVTVGRPMINLVDTHHLDVKVSAPLTIAPHLNASRNVLVKWQGKLLSLPIRTWSKAGDQATRTFDVRLAADGTAMMAGTAVTVSLPKSESKEAILVPRDALVLREKEIFVMKVDEEDVAKKVNVLVGQGIGAWVAVSGDITSGDEVVIRGGERLQPGQKIRRNDDSSTVVASLGNR